LSAAADPFYQADSEFDLLGESQRYRHVRYEPGSVDFTWEREWRVQVDELPFDFSEVTLIVPDRRWEKWLHDRHTAMLGRRALILNGLIGPKSVAEIPHHFVVLEDLGVEFPTAVGPPLVS